MKTGSDQSRVEAPSEGDYLVTIYAEVETYEEVVKTVRSLGIEIVETEPHFCRIYVIGVPSICEAIGGVSIIEWRGIDEE